MSRFPFPALTLPRLPRCPRFPPLLRALCVLAAWLGLAGAGHAAEIVLNGAAQAGCSYTAASKTYICAALPYVEWNDSITIPSGYTVKVTSSVAIPYNRGLKMSGTARLESTGSLDIGDINPSNLSISGGTLAAGANFKIGDQAQTITADVSAASMTIGSGSTTKITGTLTSTGPVALGSHATVVGPISGTVVSTASPATITGSVTASTSFTLASGSTLSGNVSAPVVRLSASGSRVTGDITAPTSLDIESGNTVNGNIVSGNMTMDPAGAVVSGSVNVTGNLTMGSGDTINGNVVVSGSVLLQAANAYISGNLSANAVTLNSGGRVGQYITCTGPQSSTTPCSCVTNNSGYPFNSTNGPKCTAPAASAPHHLLISHPLQALTCQPSTVTVTACANAACSAPHFSNGMTVTLAPGGATFTIGNTGINAAATIQPLGAGTSLVSAVASVTPAAATVCVGPGGAASQCAVTGLGEGLTFAIANHVAETSQALEIQALQAGPNGQSCVPLLKNTNKSINFSCAYGNPSSGTQPIRVWSPAANKLLPLSASESSACSAAGADIALDFDNNGKAGTSLMYADVGAVTLNAQYLQATPAGNAKVTGSDGFTAAPARFAFVIKKPGAPNTLYPGPLAPVAADNPIFMKAGEPFIAALKVVNYIGNPTPNFGKETTPETYALTQKVLLPIDNAANPALSQQFQPLVNGVGAEVQTSWNEVGILNFEAKLNNITGYLGAGAPSFVTTGSINVGRFIPDHFRTEMTGAAVLTSTPMDCPTAMGCPTAFPKYIFSGQAADLRVIAYTAGTGGIARNYTAASGLAKDIAVTAWGALGVNNGVELSGAANPGGGSMQAPYLSVPASSFNDNINKGVGHGTIQYGWPLSALVAPTNVYFRATSEGVSSLRSSGTVEGGLALVSGRLLVVNNYGSEHYSMPVTVRAQYWNGAAAYLDSALAGSTPVPKLNFTACQKGLLKADGSCVTIKQLNNTPLTFQAGRATFQLAKPGVAGSTSLDLKDTVPYMRPAAGKLTFGVYNAGPVLYLREVY